MRVRRALNARRLRHYLMGPASKVAFFRVRGSSGSVATGIVRELASHQHGIEKTAAL